jgi:exodeoxyribonuclease VII small subunit
MAKAPARQTDQDNDRQPDFEAALARLEQIVDKLDDGNLPLADSLALFKEGTKLAKLCRELLTQAELVVKEALHDSRSDEKDEFEDEEAGETEDGP